MSIANPQSTDVAEELRNIRRFLEELTSQIRGNKPLFNEFENEEFANWKRVRAAIEHENTLINHRLTWLFSSQAFLIAAFAAAYIQWSKSDYRDEFRNLFPYLLALISFIAVGICIFIHRGIVQANEQLEWLSRWFYGERGLDKLKMNHKVNEADRLGEETRLTALHPPIQRRAPEVQSGKILDYVLGQRLIPVLFSVTWILMVTFAVAINFNDALAAASNNWKIILASAVGFTIGALAMWGLLKSYYKTPKTP